MVQVHCYNDILHVNESNYIRTHERTNTCPCIILTQNTTMTVYLCLEVDAHWDLGGSKTTWSSKIYM